MNRRGFLAGGTALAGLKWSQALASQDRYMLPEWERHAECVMAWCAAHDHYSHREIGKIRDEQALIAKAISAFEPVTMLVNPGDRKAAAARCGPSVRTEILEHYDTWTRDTLPTIGWNTSAKHYAQGWNFNVWGEKFKGYDADRTLAERFANARGLEFYPARQIRGTNQGDSRRLEAGPKLVAEGGAMESDGLGNLITTETCLLNPNRNPGLSKAEVEASLMQHAPARNVIWLWGSEADEVTDGHVDGICRFIRPGLVVTEVSDDPQDPEYHDLRENAARLEAARDHRGDQFEVVRLKRPRWDRMPERGPDFAASYVNAYFPNGGIVMPRFGDAERDDAARDLFAQLEPSRRIVQLDVDQIAEGGGGIHCCTMQIPA